mmetsp:Transcript_141/g.367  ORF Transcript_141/g.367 Transcript_141/m.367 type:complete len:160 (-) Transcript_141:21-500(-)
MDTAVTAAAVGPGGAGAAKRDTPWILDGNLSLPARRILFGCTAFFTLFAFYLYKTCQPDDLLDPEYDGGVCGVWGSGGSIGSPAERWGLVCLVMTCALCCCPCFSIADHMEWYDAFPILKRARDRATATAQLAHDQRMARYGGGGRLELPTHTNSGGAK